jgi:acylphosphatase
MMSKRIFFRVHGTVQGVNFRFEKPISTTWQNTDVDRSFTQSKAQSYGLTGFVENTPNNKVSGDPVAGLHRQFRVLRKPG